MSTTGATTTMTKPEPCILPEGAIIDGINCSGMIDNGNGIPVYLNPANHRPLSETQQVKLDALLQTKMPPRELLSFGSRKPVEKVTAPVIQKEKVMTKIDDTDDTEMNGTEVEVAAAPAEKAPKTPRAPRKKAEPKEKAAAPKKVAAKPAKPEKAAAKPAKAAKTAAPEAPKRGRPAATSKKVTAKAAEAPAKRGRPAGGGKASVTEAPKRGRPAKEVTAAPAKRGRPPGNGKAPVVVKAAKKSSAAPVERNARRVFEDTMKIKVIGETTRRPDSMYGSAFIAISKAKTVGEFRTRSGKDLPKNLQQAALREACKEGYVSVS